MYSSAEGASNKRKPLLDPAGAGKLIVVLESEEHAGMDDGAVLSYIRAARLGAGADEMERLSYRYNRKECMAHNR